MATQSRSQSLAISGSLGRCWPRSWAVLWVWLAPRFRRSSETRSPTRTCLASRAGRRSARCWLSARIALVLRIATNVERRLDVRVLLLSGVVAGTFFNACILLALSFQETEAFRAAVFWMMGGLGGASWRSVWMLALALGGASIVLFGLARSFDLIAHGEETAGFLGVPVQRVRLLAYLTASLLTAGAVVAAGGIGFVGLFVPHTVRLVWGGGHRFLLPATLLVGAAFLPLADTVARVITAPAELPLGVITAFVGVPFFVLVLRRQTRRAPA